MTIYMACCCDDETEKPACGGSDTCRSNRFFLVEGKANVFYDYSLKETEELIFEQDCLDNYPDCEFSSVQSWEKKHGMFVNVTFKAIMKQDGFPGSTSAPELNVVSGYLLIKKSSSLTRARGKIKSEYSKKNCSSGPDSHIEHDRERSFKQDKNDQEIPEIRSFSLTATIQYLECGGINEVWDVGATLANYGIEVDFDSRDLSTETVNGEVTTTRDYDATCQISLDDLDGPPIDTKINLSTLAPIAQDPSGTLPCFLDYRRKPIVLFDHNIPWQYPHCWINDSGVCDDTVDTGCMDWAQRLGANQFIVQGENEKAFIQDVGIAKFTPNGLRFLCGRGNPCNDDDQTGCVDWYALIKQGSIATLPDLKWFHKQSVTNH